MSDQPWEGLRIVRDGDAPTGEPVEREPRIDCSEIGEDVVVVHLMGDFDMDGTEALRRTFTEVVSQIRCKVVIDLSQTMFMDSMALGAIIGAGKRAQAWGGWLRLVGPTLYLRKVLRVTALDVVYGVYADVDEAIASG